MTTKELADKIKAEHGLTFDVRYLRPCDDGLSPDALYLVTESRKLHNDGGYTMTGAVRRVYAQTLGCPVEYLHEALRHMGG